MKKNIRSAAYIAALAGAAMLVLAPAPRAQTRPSEVPRERTFVVGSRSAGADLQGVGVANPYVAGEFTNTGQHLMTEPLFFFNTNRAETIPWLATAST